MRREPLTGNTGERTLSLTNLSTKRQRVAETGKNGNEGGLSYLESFFAGESRIVSSAPP